MPPQSYIIDLCSDSEEDDPRPSKRQRIDSPTPKKQRDSAPLHSDLGKDSTLEFLQLPFDVHVEIYEFLCPLDLLRLARTCKCLRGILLNRNHSFFWRNARRNVNQLPKCPEDMSEPSYARLMFDHKCYICLRSSAPDTLTTSWTIRMRMCFPCYKNVDYFDYGYNMTSDKHKIEKELLDLVTPVHTTFYNPVYYVPDVLRMATQYQELELKGDAERSIWISQQRDRRSRDMKFAEDYSHWDWQWKQNLMQELIGIQQRRKEDIIRRLTEEGFGEEFEHFNQRQEYEFGNHVDVRPCEPLSVAAWRGMRGRLVSLMVDIRLARLAKEHKLVIKARLDILRAALDSYRSKCPQAEIIPPIADLATSTQFRSIIERPTKSKVSASHFEQLFRGLPSFTARWLPKIDRKLTEQLCQEDTLPEGDWSKPDLGTVAAFFRCLTCKGMEPYPSILQHNCEASFEKWREEYDHPRELMTIYKHLQCAPCLELIESQFSLHVPAFKRMHIILRTCGLSPSTTEAQLDAINPLLECVHSTCAVEMGIGYRHAMRWRRALLHSLEIADPSWKVLSSTDAKKLAPLEFGQGAKEDRRIFVCSLCDYGPASTMEMKNHMVYSHDLPGTDVRSWEYHPSATFEARARNVVWFMSKKKKSK